MRGLGIIGIKQDTLSTESDSLCIKLKRNVFMCVSCGICMEGNDVTVVVECVDGVSFELLYARESVSGDLRSDDEILDMAESEVATLHGPHEDLKAVYIKDE